MVARLEDYFQQEQQSPVTQVDAMEQPAAVVEEPAATSMDEAKAAPAEEAADSEKPIPTVAAIKTIKEEAAEDGTFAGKFDYWLRMPV